ncbi:MAG: acyloxyacyl hydrolase [Methylacidiphilales bacterium]|nr:acyloxyacyl hydrolase [Candidatus Methylacidiphilales bacterium]
MKNGIGKLIGVSAAGLFCMTLSAWAGAGDLSKQVLTKVEPVAPLFTEDRIEFQAMQGALFSQNDIGPSIPTYDYAKTTLRLGWMLDTPAGDGSWYDGNFEAVMEISTNFVFSGFGNVHVGPTGLVRYNFVQPGWKVVPYVQGGAGIVYSDGYQTSSQRALGGCIEFTPQAGVGIRCLLNNNWSVDLEADFEHISNAGIYSRNLGVNAIGGQVGFSYFFDRLWQ